MTDLSQVPCYDAFVLPMSLNWAVARLEVALKVSLFDSNGRLTHDGGRLFKQGRRMLSIALGLQ